MSIAQKVVAHFRNGEVLKGHTQNFSPNRGSFEIAASGNAKPVKVRIEDLKALFFVKTLAGNRLRVDVRGFIEGPRENSHGTKVAARFGDREWVCGYSLSYAPKRIGFFLFPADTNTNNLKIFVVTHSAEEICIGGRAEEMAQKFRSRAA